MGSLRLPFCALVAGLSFDSNAGKWRSCPAGARRKWWSRTSKARSQVRPRGQSKAVFWTARDSGHVKDVGDRGKAVDVRHISPNRLAQYRRIGSCRLIQTFEHSGLGGVQDSCQCSRRPPPTGIPRSAFRHPCGDLNEVAVSPENFRPLALVHRLVEEDAGQPFSNVALHRQPVAPTIQKHLASDELGRAADVGLLVLGGHHADVALAEFCLRFEDQNLNGSR